MVILLPQSPKCWDYRCVPPGLTFVFCFERFVVLLHLKIEHFWGWRAGLMVKSSCYWKGPGSDAQHPWRLTPSPPQEHVWCIGTYVSTILKHKVIDINLTENNWGHNESECLLVSCFSLQIYLLSFSVYGCFAFMYVCAYEGQKKAPVRSPENGVLDGHEPSCESR